jgi:ribosomal protein S6--L-glutamate ligase
MNIAILSRKASLYSTQRLRQAALMRGHQVNIVDYLRCYMNITSAQPAIMYRGKVMPKFDAIIPRIGASRTFYGTAVVRQFEMMNVLSANSSMSISRSRDKLRSLQILARRGIGLPITGFAHDTQDVDSLIEMVGGAPLVVKLLEGTQGIGVVLAETKQAAESVIEAFRGLNVNILVQEFIEEAQGTDIRAFVVGNQVVASMKRKAKKGDFRSNLHRGGTPEMIDLSPEEARTAVAAASEMGLDIAGVDMLQSKRGPVVMEVNSSPGLRGIEQATHLDVADAIIQFLEEKTKTAKLHPKEATG